MNKTISVSISGLMFVLDEDAFGRLSDYLRHLRQHFAARQGEAEIIADIESRIAELLQSRLNDQKQVITLADVEWVMAVMGQPWQMDEEVAAEQGNTAEPEGEARGPRRLLRDINNKQVGGVAAGLGYFFNTDPLVFRLIFIALAFIKGFGVVAYLILWALTPGKSDLQDTDSRKARKSNPQRQFYRDPDNKKVAGVAAGLGHYFNVDPLIIRLLFVLLSFASGVGLVAYLVLWMIAPVASSTADKLRMKGQAVTIENIERTVKEEAERLGRKMSEMGAEAGQSIRNAGQKAGPAVSLAVKNLLNIISVVAGVFFLLIGIVLLVVFVALFAGWEGFVFFEDAELPFALNDLISLIITDPGLSQLAVVSFAAFLIIPAIMLVYTSLRLITANRFQLPGLSHIAGVLWLLSVIGLAYSGYMIGSDFRETGKTELLNKELESSGKMVVMVAPQFDTIRFMTLIFNNQRFLFNKDDDGNTLKMVPHFYVETSGANSQPSIMVEASAKGEEEDLARERSRKLMFPVEYRNDTLFVPAWFSFEASQGIRAQRVNLRVYLPYGTEVYFDPSTRTFFENNPRSYWRLEKFAGKRYLATNQGLKEIP